MPSNDEIHFQIREVLERFNELISTNNLNVLAEFAPSEEMHLVGSETDEITYSSQEIESFVISIFARDTNFSWEWDRIDFSCFDNLAWFFASRRIILFNGKNSKNRPTEFQEFCSAKVSDDFG